jgi:hypothetical protein
MGVLLISAIARTLSANVRHWSGCRRLVCLGLAACATAGTPAGPQDRALTPATAADPFDLTRVPPRPPLPATDADTNSARAYLRLGLATLDTTHYPEATAAEAFYWAARLDPGLSAGYYLRWAAISLALANPTPVQGRVRLVALSNSNGEARGHPIR